MQNTKQKPLEAIGSSFPDRFEETATVQIDQCITTEKVPVSFSTVPPSFQGATFFTCLFFVEPLCSPLSLIFQNLTSFFKLQLALLCSGLFFPCLTNRNMVRLAQSHTFPIALNLFHVLHFIMTCVICVAHLLVNSFSYGPSLNV